MAGDNFRHPAPYEECRLPTVGIPCKTTVIDASLNSVGAVPSSLNPVSLLHYLCSLSNAAAMGSMSQCPCSLLLFICPCTCLIPSSVSSSLIAKTQNDLQRILGADEDCSSSDESYIG